MSVNAQPPGASKLDPATHGYAEDSSSTRARLARGLIVAATLGFCVFYGMAFAFFAPYLMLLFAIPLVVLAGIVIWALPDGRSAPVGMLRFMFFAFIAALVLWPNYIGFALPGLPWFTMARFTGFPVTLLFFLCYATSREVRASLHAALGAAPLIWKLVVAFVLMEMLSIPLSQDKGLSINHFVNAQIYWTVMFFAAAYIFSKPGTLDRFAKMLWVMAMMVGVLCIWEVRLKHVPWLGHIPHMLQIQDPVVLLYLAGQGRAGTTEYRAQGTFLHPLALGEYIAIVMPFVLHYVASEGAFLRRIAAAFSALFLVYIALLSGSRSSMIGCVAAVGLYVLLWGAGRWRQRPKDLIGPAVVLSYPGLFVMAMASTFLVGKIRRKIWGGGETATSTEGRLQQWAKGIPMVVNHPLGHGIGTAAQTLNFVLPSGLVTIDSYYLSIALEYGPLGVILYYGTFIYAVVRGLSATFSLTRKQVDDQELLMIGPVALMLVNFIILKAIYSEEYNHAFAFVGLGVICALMARIARQSAPATNRRGGAASTAATPARAVARPRPVHARA